MTPLATTRYGNPVKNSERIVEAVRELMSASNPGLLTKDDLARLEQRVDELGEILDDIEQRLENGGLPDPGE